MEGPIKGPSYSNKKILINVIIYLVTVGFAFYIMSVMSVLTK